MRHASGLANTANRLEKAGKQTMPDSWASRPLRRARALIVLDPASVPGMTTEQEFDEIREAWRDLHDIELDATQAERFSPNSPDADRCEVLIFDWGGMSLGSDLMQHQIRWVLQWTEDHPSKLVVIRSMAGLYLKKAWYQEQTPLLVNLTIDHGELYLPDWWVKSLKWMPGREPRYC